MNKKSNGLVVFLVLLIIVCLTCGTLGLLESKKDVKKTDNEDKEEKEYVVTYRYYLDGTEVDEMIKQEYEEIANPEFEGATEKLPNYSFERYTCQNNVTGEFDEEKWEFVPDTTEATGNGTTCRIYFTKNLHTVTFKASNGKLPNNEEKQEMTARVDKDTIINIIPNDGYQFDKVTCTNNATAEYNSETHDLVAKNITKDNTTCTISFKIRDFKVEVRAANASISEEAKTAKYGESVTYTVTPAENYIYDSVSCTNDQKATFENGVLTVSGITNDTVCSIQFKPLKYSVSLEVEGGKLLETSQSPQEVSEGKTVAFAVSPNSTKDVTAKLDCGEDVKAEFTSNIVYVYNVTKNITCKLVLTEKAD